MFGLCWPNKPWLAAMVWWVVGATNMRVFVCVCGRKTITFWWCIWVCLRARVYLVVMRAVYLCTTHNFINASGLWCGIADAIASTPHFSIHYSCLSAVGAWTRRTQSCTKSPPADSHTHTRTHACSTCASEWRPRHPNVFIRVNKQQARALLQIVSTTTTRAERCTPGSHDVLNASSV